MEKNQKKLQNFFFKLRKNSSTLTVISFFFLFSFLLTFNDGFYQIFFNQFSHLKHFLNKKAIFFFFNAILLFLAKSSGLLASSVEQPPMAARLPAPDSGEKTQLSPAKKLNMEESLEILQAGDMVLKEKQQVLLEVREDEKKKPGLMEGDCTLEEEEEEEEEVWGDMEELGVDELNKKCEEFILRFRKEIKMEALQMVIV